MSPTSIVAYLALFATVGFLFVFASLVLGWFLRASAPTAQKLETYECGEPAVGPGFLQFDLRFYVVALVFLIFEVEVAFFFPPATVFGKAVHQKAPAVVQSKDTLTANGVSATSADKDATAATACSDADCSLAAASDKSPALLPTTANSLALASMIDLGVFFAVLLVGFAFVWSRGDLDWVRATRHPATSAENATLVANWQRSNT